MRHQPRIRSRWASSLPNPNANAQHSSWSSVIGAELPKHDTFEPYSLQHTEAAPQLHILCHEHTQAFRLTGLIQY